MSVRVLHVAHMVRRNAAAAAGKIHGRPWPSPAMQGHGRGRGLGYVSAHPVELTPPRTAAASRHEKDGRPPATLALAVHDVNVLCRAVQRARQCALTEQETVTQWAAAAANSRSRAQLQEWN